MKVKKLDRRMSGHGDFARCVDFSGKEYSRFIEIRNWCWDQWGPSCEYNFWCRISNPNPAWCWLTDEWRTRIYFTSDKEAQWYHLKWG